MAKPRLSRRVKTHKGKYTPKNVHKYFGDPTQIYYRSGWELAVCKWADSNKCVEVWGSEEVVIPYISVVDGRKHDYFVDFFLKIRKPNGSTITLLVDVKPANQTRLPPTQPGKVPGNLQERRTRMKQVIEYGRNASKWDAALKYAEKNNMKFEIWTQHTLRKLGILE